MICLARGQAGLPQPSGECGQAEHIFKERKLLFFKKTKDSLWKRAKKAQKNAETIQNDSDTVITFETEQDINEEQDDTE